jgi:hypothetical protein
MWIFNLTQALSMHMIWSLWLIYWTKCFAKLKCENGHNKQAWRLIYGSFTLARFVCKNTCNIASRYCLPYLPWQLGSFLSLLCRLGWPSKTLVAKANTMVTVMCRCRWHYHRRYTLNFANVNTTFFGILSLEVHSGQNVGGRQNIFSSFLCND